MEQKSEHTHFREQANQYLREHRIVELFQDISASLCYHRPEDVWSHIMEQLQVKQENGFKSVIIGREEIVNYFRLQDLRQLGHIPKDKAILALKQIAFSRLHTDKIDSYPIQDSLDLEEFVTLCQKIFDIKL